jgi:hypothetical protein
VDDVREGLAAVRFDDGGAGVVAGGLYGKDHGLFIAFRRIEGTHGLHLDLAGHGRHRAGWQAGRIYSTS